MDIGPRHTERGHSRPSRTVARDRPRCDLRGHQQTRLDRTQFLRQPVEMRHRRHQSRPQTQDRLDESDGAGRRFGVAEIAFGRTQRAPAAVCSVDLREAAELQRITDRRTGSVRLDHADGGCVDGRHRQRGAVDIGLGVQRRCRDRRRGPVLIGGGSADHGQDAVPVAQCVGQSLEQNHRATIGTHEPVGGDVEGVAAAGRRQHALSGSRCADGRIEQHLATTGQRVIALTVIQTPAGQMHGQQTGGTRTVDRQRRAA